MDALRNTPPSARRPVPEAGSAAGRDSLINVLAGYIVAETTALEGAGILTHSAPNRAAKLFLAGQAADEGRHLEVFNARMCELGVTDVTRELGLRVNPFLLEFRERLLALLAGGRFEHALFAQNLILDAVQCATLQHHLEHADPRTQAMLAGIVEDERRHIAFAERLVARALVADPGLRTDLAQLRMELDYLVLGSFEHTLSELRTEQQHPVLLRAYLEGVRRLG